ncbi:MAG: PLD nuclease N-terminal domain-containing protein [Kiloniellales bacterium]
MFEFGGIMGVIALILFIYAALKIFKSDASDMAKALWIVFILLVPILGFIIWLLFGPAGPGKG